MPSNKSAAAAFAIVMAVASWVLVGLGQAPQPSALPLEPTRERGSSISPAYEGWFPNDDETFTMLFGYFNGTHGKRSTSRSARTIASSPAVRTWASRLTSTTSAVGRLQHPSAEDFGTKSLHGR